MIWWWIGNAVFLLVVIPVVVALLHRLARPVLEIRRYVDDALEHGRAVSAELEALALLRGTHERAQRVSAEGRRYGAALDRLT